MSAPREPGIPSLASGLREGDHDSRRVGGRSDGRRRAGPCEPSAEYACTLPAILDRRTATPAFRQGLRHWRDQFLRSMRRPDLHMVIWMATRRCNLKCTYCVLPHEESPGRDLTTKEVEGAFRQIAEDFDPARIMVGITGGEATLRPDLVDLVRFMKGLGFRTVAVDSNGINYGRRPELMDRLVDAGMTCPTISVDGIGRAQRALRGDSSAGRLTWGAIESVQKKYPDLGTTTICAASPRNLDEVPEVFARFEDLGIAFARLSAIFPLGRAASDPGEVLSPEQVSTVLAWVAEQRALFAAGHRDLEIEFVDDGWCGEKWEGGLLRGSFLYCRAGVTVLGIEHDGRIVGCPVIHSSFNEQGNVLVDRVSDVWRDGFAQFRDREWLRREECASCAEWNACVGGSLHNRDDEGNLARCTAMTLGLISDSNVNGQP